LTFLLNLARIAAWFLPPINVPLFPTEGGPGNFSSLLLWNQEIRINTDRQTDRLTDSGRAVT